jgi:hypothetical protein
VADGGNEIISNFWYVYEAAFGNVGLIRCSGDCGSTMWREGATFPGKRIVKVCGEFIRSVVVGS